MQIDHVTMCGENLDRMREQFARIGLRTEYGGAHANGLTHMALAGFPDGSYLELIAPLESTEPAKAAGMMAGWMPLMLGNAGPGAWAVRVSGIHAHVKELRARCITVQAPEAGGRKRPDGFQLKWETALIGPSPAGSVLPFMIEDITDRRHRAPSNQQPLGASGVGKVVIGVRDLKASVDLFRIAFAWLAPVVEEHAHWGTLAHFAERPVILACQRDQRSWLGKRVEKFGDCPAAFLMSGRASAQAKTEFWFGEKVCWLPEAQTGAHIGLVWSE